MSKEMMSQIRVGILAMMLTSMMVTQPYLIVAVFAWWFVHAHRGTVDAVAEEIEERIGTAADKRELARQAAR